MTRVRLVTRVVTRDSAISVRWLSGSQGRETLRMMGVPDIAPARLDEETARIASFIDTNDPSARVLFRAGFARAGDPYIDPEDGLRWQNFVLRAG